MVDTTIPDYHCCIELDGNIFNDLKGKHFEVLLYRANVKHAIKASLLIMKPQEFQAACAEAWLWLASSRVKLSEQETLQIKIQKQIFSMETIGGEVAIDDKYKTQKFSIKALKPFKH